MPQYSPEALVFLTKNQAGLNPAYIVGPFPFPLPLYCPNLENPFFSNKYIEKFIILIRSLVWLSYYDHPIIQQEIGYSPIEQVNNAQITRSKLITTK